MKTIDISEWTQFSQRPYSRSFVSPDKKWMLKLEPQNTGNPPDKLIREHELCKIANELGVPTPKVGDLVATEDGAIGILYEYIPGKKSISRILSEQPEKIEEYMCRFASVFREFHSREADTNVLPPFKKQVEIGLSKTQIFTEAEKEILLKKLDRLPQGTKCLHGDMTPSNAICTEDRNYVIDLGGMSYGNPLFDVGSFRQICRFAADETSVSLFHFDSALLKKCWTVFVKYYFDTTDVRSVEEMLEPYAEVSLLPILAVAPNAQTVRTGKDLMLK